jgi:hypothetical protein
MLSIPENTVIMLVLSFFLTVEWDRAEAREDPVPYLLHGEEEVLSAAAV